MLLGVSSLLWASNRVISYQLCPLRVLEEAWVPDINSLFRETFSLLDTDTDFESKNPLDPTTGYPSNLYKLSHWILLSPIPRDNQGDDVSRSSGCIHWVPRDILINSLHLHRWRPTSPPHILGSSWGYPYTCLFLEDIGSFSMRYKPGIMVSIISIFEAFEFVSVETSFNYVTSPWTLCSLPCFTLVVDIVP
jgi:hypothetical protein